MSKTIHNKMHEQHERWRAGLVAWQADVATWKQALKDAVADLREVGAMVPDSADGLEVHRDGVWEGLQHASAHGQVSGEEAKRAENRTDHDWQTGREALSSSHVQLGDRHERIRRYPHDVDWQNAEACPLPGGSEAVGRGDHPVRYC